MARPAQPYVARRPSVQPSGRTPSRKVMHIHLLLLPVTALTGLGAWFVCRWIDIALVETAPRPLVIGLMFFTLYLPLAVAVFLTSRLSGTFSENILMSGGGPGSTVLILSLAAALVFGLAALLQWVYQKDFLQEVTGPSAYIFVIDDSSSMAGSDPRQERYSAIPSVLENMGEDFPYMIYSFADDVSLVREMAPASTATPSLHGEDNGTTSIRAALRQVLADYSNGVWSGGRDPKVLLLTDGYATDIDAAHPVDDILEQYAAAQISVSTVGLGAVDEPLMRQIAETTGGVFIDIAEASEIADAMRTAVTQDTTRDLLSTRRTANLNILYGLLRILFVAILGTGIGCLMAVAYGFRESAPLTTVSSGMKALFGGTLLEIGTDLGLSDTILGLVLWVLLAVTLAVHRIPPRKPPARRPAHGPTYRDPV